MRYKEWAERNKAERVPPVPPARVVDSGQISGVVCELGTGERESADTDYADREWDRFLSVAKPTATGGLYDPGNCSPRLLRLIQAPGIDLGDERGDAT